MTLSSRREEPREGPAETKTASEEGPAEDAEGKAPGEEGQEEGRRRLRSLSGPGERARPARRRARAFVLTLATGAFAPTTRPFAAGCSSASPRRTRRCG